MTSPSRFAWSLRAASGELRRSPQARKDDRLTADQTGLEVPAEVVEFLGQHHTLTLATSAQSGAPRASTFLYANEGANLYFWSRATTLTAHQIQQNPVVGFTVD